MHKQGLLVFTILGLALSACHSIPQPVSNDIKAGNSGFVPLHSHGHSYIGNNGNSRLPKPFTNLENLNWIVADKSFQYQGISPHIFFEKDSFSGFTGCNYIFGTYSIHGQSIKFSNVAITHMSCESSDVSFSKLEANENKLVNHLNGSVAYKLNGNTLSLIDNKQKTLTFGVAAYPLENSGSNWNIATVSSNDVITELKGMQLSATVIGETLDVVITGGCNTMFGTAKIINGQAIFGQLSSGLMLCNNIGDIYDTAVSKAFNNAIFKVKLNNSKAAVVSLESLKSSVLLVNASAKINAKTLKSNTFNADYHLNHQ